MVMGASYGISHEGVGDGEGRGEGDKSGGECTGGENETGSAAGPGTFTLITTAPLGACLGGHIAVRS